MNGPDLGFLAARASVLEDRTTERLGDVHARIAQARRQRRVGVVAGVACLAVALIVGLVLVQGHQGTKNPSPAPPLAPRSAPEVGTCWMIPVVTDDVDPDNWYDDSPEVPCTQPHNAENVTAFFLGDPTPEAAEQLWDDCDTAVARYLGIDEDHWVPWNSGMSLPTREQIAQGTHWVQCAAMMPTSLDGGPGWLTPTTSVEGVAADPPAEFMACTDDPPTSYDQQRVPCNGPHRYEQTGELTYINHPGTYPSAAERAGVARKKCPATVPAGSDAISTTALWDRRTWSAKGRPVWGACFMQRSDGTPLPAR